MSDTTENPGPNPAPNLARLRATLAQRPESETRIPLGHPEADAALRGGLARGALHEVFARVGHESAATGFAAALATRLAANRRILWIRQDYSALEFGEPSATGLLELGLNPERLFLVCAAHAEDAVRAAADALSCAALGAVVIEIPGTPKVLDLVTSRRLTLAAAQTDVPAILLRFAAEPEASAAETRWCVRAAPSPADEENWGQPVFAAELVRNRHGRTGRWVMEWNCDACLFTADRGAVAAAAFDRPAAAALEGEGGRRRSVA
jgi:protein ImuA